METIKKELVLLFILIFCIANNLSAQSDSLPRGAFRMPYIRYEADKGSYGGGALVKGPSFDQANTASEASEKKYLELLLPGSYVSWTLQHPIDGVVLRFTLPDAEHLSFYPDINPGNNGLRTVNDTGRSGQLALYVNDSFISNVPISSYHAWQYFDNKPGLDVPRMRFDEVRFILPKALAPGDVIKLQKLNDDGLPYGIDFIEAEEIGAPVTKPNGFLDVTDAPFNAVPDDGKDDSPAIKAALDEARHLNTGIFIPTGKYLLGSRLNIDYDQSRIQGAGIWHTELRFTDSSNNGGIYADGSRIHISDLYMTTVNNKRNSYRAFGGYWGNKSVIENVWLTHFGVGLWISARSFPYRVFRVTDGLTVRNCRIRNTYADGCNFASGTSHSILEHSDVRNNCDDGLATWSSEQRNVGPTTFNTFRFNTVEFIVRAAGVGIFGGQQHVAHHCIIRDNFAGAGIRVNSTFEAWPFSDSNFIRIFEMTVERCGTRKDLFDSRLGAIDIVVNRFDVRNVRFSNIDVYDSQVDGLNIKENVNDSSYSINNIYFDDILLHGAACDMLGDGYGIYAIKPVKGSIQTTAVTIEGSMTGKIFEKASSFNIRNVSSAKNQRPVANAGIDMTLRKGITSVQLNGTASSDPEGKQMYYEWIQVDGDAVNIDDPNAVKPLVTGLESNETYIFRLMVHDGILSDADVVVVGPKIPVTIKENKLWILWIVMGAGLFFFFIFLKRKKGKVRV